MRVDELFVHVCSAVSKLSQSVFGRPRRGVLTFFFGVHTARYALHYTRVHWGSSLRPSSARRFCRPRLLVYTCLCMYVYILYMYIHIPTV